MERMLNLVLFGPPGAGKGTQSENLINKYGLVHLSTGDILRSEIAKGTDLGRKAKEVMDRGELVSDAIVIAMIESKLDANPNAKGFIFDGFPRTIAQAVALDDVLQKKGTGISAMLALEVSDEELTERLLKRGLASGRPDDANKEVIMKRINEYNNKTLPLKNYYSEQGKFHSIQGIGTIEEIFKLLTERIVFLKAEMDLTALESDIEHLDLTIQDFEVADDIAPELLLEIDAIKRAEAEEEEDAKEEKRVAKRLVKSNKAAFNQAHANVKGSVKGKAKATSGADKQKEKPKASMLKKKASLKKTDAKSAKKTTKKAAPKKGAKKAVKKAAQKKQIKKVARKKIIKKAASKKAVKKLVKKPVKKVSSKKAIKKLPTKKAGKKPVVKAKQKR